MSRNTEVISKGGRGSFQVSNLGKTIIAGTTPVLIQTQMKGRPHTHFHTLVMAKKPLYERVVVTQPLAHRLGQSSRHQK